MLTADAITMAIAVTATHKAMSKIIMKLFVHVHDCLQGWFEDAVNFR